MPKSFKNAPLVEVVAELHWTPQPFLLSNSGAPGQFGLLNSALCKSFFQKFLVEASKLGFSSSERLVPQGMLVLPNQVVYRLRTGSGTRFLHVGIGVLSANAVPPYQSWDEFLPTLRDSFSAAFDVLRSFGEIGNLNPTLRYINAFTAAHMGDSDPALFMSEVLNLRPPIPPVLQNQIDNARPIRSTMQLTIPLKPDLLYF